MGVIIYSFNLNILPKMAYGVFECDIVVTELHAYDFVIKDFVSLFVPDPIHILPRKIIECFLKNAF